MFGQTAQVAFIRLDIKDSTRLTSVRNATITFVKNDTSFISGRVGQVKLTKFLADTVVVTHWYLGTSKMPFTVKNTNVKELKIFLPKSCKSIPKTNICPVCKSNKDVIGILYGMPNEKAIKMADKGKVKLGGCMVDDCIPLNYCKKDNVEF